MKWKGGRKNKERGTLHVFTGTFYERAPFVSHLRMNKNLCMHVSKNIIDYRFFRWKSFANANTEYKSINNTDTNPNRSLE